MIRAIVDLPFALAQRVGLCLLAHGSRRFALSRASFEPFPGFAANPKSYVSPFFATLANMLERLPVFTNRSVSDSNQNHFIPCAELIRV